MPRFRRTDRSLSNPAVVTALAFALAALAISGARMTVVSPNESGITASSSEEQAARLMAAAVAAARDLLGVDRTHVAVDISANVTTVAPTNATTAHVRLSGSGSLPVFRLSERLLDLPPPIC